MTEDEQIDAPICPVCDNRNNKLFLGYSGNFLGIKELYQCEICELIFGHKMPNKNIMNQVIFMKLFQINLINNY